MEKIKSMMFLFIFMLVMIYTTFSQVLMPEVIVASTRYKYLTAVDNKELSQPVKILEHSAASFNIKNSEFYDDEYDEYYISFYLPSGYILATYTKEGKLLRTAERYKNVSLPSAVSNALLEKYPDWSIPKDVYLVTFEEESGAKKVWKLLLKKGDERLRVKLNEKGEYITKL